MATGLPVVATRVGGTPEVIEDGVSGLLVAPKDPQALAKAILQLLRNQGLAKQMGRVAQERVRTQFSFERLLSDLDSLYLEARLGEGKKVSRSGAGFLKGTG